MENHELSNISSCNVCICCNGLLESGGEIIAITRRADRLIAADGGARNLAGIGLKPDVIIGDMDSLENTLWLEDPLIKKVKFPQVKDKSDSELAVEWAFQHGCAKAILLGAWGSRMDHVFGHGMLLMRYSARLFMWHEGYLLSALKAGQKITLPLSVGSAVSLLSFENHARVRTEGLKYVLDNQSLNSPSHGLSNWAEKPNPVVEVTAGKVLVYWKGGRDWLDV